jgi:ribosomal protein L1
VVSTVEVLRKLHALATELERALLNPIGNAPKLYLKKLTVSSTMGPGVSIDQATVDV